VSRLRTTRLVLGGVPGLYRAAREEVGTREAVVVVAASAWAVVVALFRSAGRPRMRNAVRHFAWSAWLAARYGVDVAEAVTAEHELHSLDPLDSEADEHNNRAGRRYGSLRRARVLQRPGPWAIWELARVGRQRWRAGRLWSVRDGVVVRGRGAPVRRTP
jgi:hypothetical protein